MGFVDLLLLAAGLCFCLTLVVVDLGSTPESVSVSEPVVVVLNASEAEAMLDAAVCEGRFEGVFPRTVLNESMEVDV